MTSKNYFLVSMLLSIMIVTLVSAATGATWSYSGATGPANWASLNTDYELCGVGLRQSPVDLTVTKKTDLPELKYSYQDVELSIENNGHTIEAHYHSNGNISIDDSRYDLLQFHFHSPSEHTEDNMSAAMEMHLVHINSNSQLAVIGVLIDEGEENPDFEKIISNAPERIGLIELPGTEINAEDLLPENPSDYASYSGSLTTPPCSESVKWMVLDNRIEVSRDQIDRFLKIIGENARPVQFLNGREILESH